jgi:hypothetical protein
MIWRKSAAFFWLAVGSFLIYSSRLAKDLSLSPFSKKAIANC